MELFDKQFVHFMWDDKLEGQKGFVANYINDLKLAVNQGYWTKYGPLHKGSDAYPFRTIVDERWCLCYCDPNYEIKKAFNEGKTVQFKTCFGNWGDCDDPLWAEDVEYRIKPEEEKHVVYLQRKGDDSGRLAFCLESMWKYSQDYFGAKTKLFVGTENECNDWCKSHQKFAQVIKAWEDGKKIQIRYGNCEWANDHDPCWDVSAEYRVKPEEEKKYRPYESSAEMIMDFIDRFNADCPSYCEPSIWVKNKWSDGRFLITGIESSPYDGENVEVQCGLHCVSGLFDTYTYLDGSPCGMEVKE